MTSTPYDIDNFDKYDNKFHICMKLSYNNISYFNVYGHIVPSYISLYSYKTDIYTTYYQKTYDILLYQKIHNDKICYATPNIMEYCYVTEICDDRYDYIKSITSYLNSIQNSEQ